MKQYISVADPYAWDVDANSQIALTEKNVRFMDAIIKIDSDYRKALPSNIKSAQWWFQKSFTGKGTNYWNSDYGFLLELVTRINKENSTHQAVSGFKGNPDPTGSNGNGLKETAQYIQSLGNISGRLIDGDPTLVDDLAVNCIGGHRRETFSFASKFCTYCEDWAYQKDKFSIFDKVLCEILPYFAWAYLGKNFTGRTKNGHCVSIVSKTFNGPTKNYAGYQTLIHDIIQKAKTLTGYQITRRHFDHLLWYFYKGDFSNIGLILDKYVGDPNSIL
jgi:hypothetical protein